MHNPAALVVVVVWGGNFPMMKVMVAETLPLYLSALRLTLTALVVVPFVLAPRWKIASLVALSVVMGTFHYGLFFVAFKQVDAAVAAIVMQMGALFSTLLAWTMLGDRFGWLRWAGVGAAAFARALGNIQAKRLGPINFFTLMGYLALFAAPQLFIASWLFESGQWRATVVAGWRFWGASLLGCGIWYRLLATYEVSRIVPYSLLAPAVGMVGGMVLLEEAVTWQKLFGGAIKLAGVTLVQSNRHKLLKAEEALT